MKKTISILLALCMLLALAGCGKKSTAETSGTEPTLTTTLPTETQPVAQESSITPIFYQVTDDSGNTIWLFGSIHVGRENFYPLPDYINDAFDQAEALAVEFDIRAYEKDTQAQVQSMQYLMYTDGTKIQDHIDPELYQEAAALMEDAPIPVMLLDMYKPVMWFSLLETMASETEDTKTEWGIDMNMIDMAYERNMPVLSIESAEFQYQMLGNFSPELQELLLKDTIEAVKSGELQRSVAFLLELWESGHEEAMSNYMALSMGTQGDQDPLHEEYYTAMGTDRNLTMADYAENLLKEGKKTLICVGAAHVVGPGAMAELLRDRGYTVTKLSPN